LNQTNRKLKTLKDAYKKASKNHDEARDRLFEVSEEFWKMRLLWDKAKENIKIANSAHIRARKAYENALDDLYREQKNRGSP